MGRSTTSSNFGTPAVSDPNNPGLAGSDYVHPQRITGRFSYDAFWWGDNRTRISLFASASEADPFSYSFAFDDGDTFGDESDFRHLVYIPDGQDDPRVIYGPGFDQQAFFAFIQKEGLKPGIQKRNEEQNGWWGQLDLRLEQEFPGFRENDRFSAFLVIRNLCNLINDDWCVLKKTFFPTVALVDMSIVDNQYVYEEFFVIGSESRFIPESLWEIRVGVEYRF